MGSRSGHVLQGRYGSECVEDDAYLLTVIRYGSYPLQVQKDGGLVERTIDEMIDFFLFEKGEDVLVNNISNMAVTDR